MSSKLLIALISISSSLIGTSFGWLLSQYSSSLKNKFEENKVRKEALYYLLDLRHFLTRYNVRTYMDIYLEKVIKLLNIDSDIDSYREEYKKFLLPHLSKIISDASEDQYENISSGFKQTVMRLSAVDPILAYTLSGREDALKQFEKIKETSVTLFETESINNVVSSLYDEVFYNNILSSIDELIEDVSKRISRKHFKDAQKSLTKIKDNNIEIDEGLENKIAPLINIIKGTNIITLGF